MTHNNCLYCKIEMCDDYYYCSDNCELIGDPIGFKKRKDKENEEIKKTKKSKNERKQIIYKS